MILTLSKAPFRIFFGNALSNFVLRNLLQTVPSRRAIYSWKLLEVNSYASLYQPVRFKSKNKVRRDSGTEDHTVTLLSQGFYSDG